MGIRWKRYFPQCKGKRSPGDRYGKVVTKGIDCAGKRGAYCPEGVPKDCGGWAIEFRDQHGVWRSIIKPGFNKTLATEAYNEVIRNIGRGHFDLPVLSKMPKVTLEGYCQRYLEHIKGSVPENTYINRRTAVKAITKHLSGFEVSKVNQVIIQRFCADLLQGGTKASTVNLYCSILRVILDMAVEEQIINRNPMTKFKRLTVEESQKRALGDEEIRAILDMPDSWERVAILIGLFAGLRLMDVMTLKWSSIDFNNSTITFAQQKTKRVNTVPVSGFLLGELKKCRETKQHGESLFFDGKSSHKAETRFSKHFLETFRGLGLEKVSFHVLRHTNASRIVELVKDVSTASRLLGHTNVATTMNYVHHGFDSKREAVRILDEHLLGLGDSTRYEPDAIQKIA